MTPRVLHIDLGSKPHYKALRKREVEMFDYGHALERLNGTYEFDDLQDQLRKLRREHLGEISPEIGINELLSIAVEKNWIWEDDAGRFHVNVSKAA